MNYLCEILKFTKMKHYLYTLIILTLFPCSKVEPEKPNTPSQAFEVTARAEGSEVILTWIEALDADGDAVTYAVVYGDTLAKGLTARTFTIQDFPYESEIAGTVVASDEKGGKTESGFTVKTGPEPWDDNYVKIPDLEFEKVLINREIDDLLDGKVLKFEALKCKSLKIDSEIIKDLTGIEFFENLILLDIKSTKIASLNLSKLENLEKLELNHNKDLRNLDIKNLTKIKELSIVNTAIEDIDLSNLRDLEVLLGFRSLKEVDLVNNGKLVELLISSDSFNKIDISKNFLLQTLIWKMPNSKSLDLTFNTSLKQVWVSGRNLSEIKLPLNGALKHLCIDRGKLTLVDLKEQKMLESFEMSINPIGEIDLSENERLISLRLSHLPIKKIDLRTLPILERLHVTNCGTELESIDISCLPRLKELHTIGTYINSICLSDSASPKEKWKKETTTTYKVCD